MGPRCFEPRLRRSRTIDVGGPWFACSGVEQEQVPLTLESNNHLYTRAPAKEDFEATMRRYLLAHEKLAHSGILKSLKIVVHL
eukprot:310793-Pyramimonas_sp.AAC.3